MASFEDMLNGMLEDYERRHGKQEQEPEFQYRMTLCTVCRDVDVDNDKGICSRCQKEQAQGYQVRSLSGRCADGFEGGHGTLFHAVEFENYVAVCGAKPGRRSAGWSMWGHGKDVTCPRCITKLERRTN